MLKFIFQLITIEAKFDGMEHVNNVTNGVYSLHTCICNTPHSSAHRAEAKDCMFCSAFITTGGQSSIPLPSQLNQNFVFPFDM